MKKGCAYCEAMHLNKCPNAFTEVAQHCGSFDHGEMPQAIDTKRSYTIYAVDFDGTLCVSKFPEIGAPNKALIEHLIKRKEQGNKLILWTCRVNEKVKEAVDWCKCFGLEFDAVNSNLPEVLAKWGGESRKNIR